MAPMKDVKVLVVDDNALILDLLMKGLAPHCEASAAADGADALLRIVDDPPDLILCDYRMPGLDGRQLYEKLRARQQTRNIPFMFLASRGDIEEKLRPIVEGVEEFIQKPFFMRDVSRRAKKVIDRLQLEKLQKQAVRPGVIQGRLEEMSILDLMQSLEMGQKSCRLTISHDGEACEMFFSAGQCTDAKLGSIDGEAAVFQAVRWPEGGFEIDFNGSPTRSTISRTTTGLLMEALRLMDEGQRDADDAPHDQAAEPAPTT
jgi:CheY-like chemotaxis protein